MDALTRGTNALFLLLGAIMVLSMHAGFAFLELGTVRKKNQVNALVKILVDFSVSTIVYFLVGFGVAYGTHFFVDPKEGLVGVLMVQTSNAEVSRDFEDLVAQSVIE